MNTDTINIASRRVQVQIEDRLRRINANHAAAFGLSPVASTYDIVSRAETIAVCLAGRLGPEVARDAAIGLLKALVPAEEAVDRSFWESELGRVLAWWTGGTPTAGRRRMIAEAVTGVSRQGVTKMINEGHLVLGPNGDVTSASLAGHLQRRYRNEVLEVHDA